jgi:hypothetical protein
VLFSQTRAISLESIEELTEDDELATGRPR